MNFDQSLNQIAMADLKTYSKCCDSRLVFIRYNLVIGIDDADDINIIIYFYIILFWVEKSGWNEWQVSHL